MHLMRRLFPVKEYPLLATVRTSPKYASALEHPNSSIFMQIAKVNKISRLDILSLIAITIIGLMHLPYPFNGDQALFTTGALKISHGAILYRDFWDLKQPGIYAFYLIAGKLFGFNEFGIHTFELLYMVAFSAVLLFTLKDYYKHPSIASLVPLLTVGIYYGVSGSWHLTQLEAIVGFPMFLSLWFAYTYSQPGGHPASRLFLSGFMGGIVLIFKFMFLPILLAFWLTTIINAVLKEPRQRPKVSFWCITIGMGIVFPLLIVFSYFAWFDTLNILYNTFLEYPPRIAIEIPGPGINRLIDGLTWFAHGFIPLIALGVIGAYASLSSRRDMMTLNLILWCIIGLGVIFLQRQSWWEYHYLLLFVPLGILATKGLDVLWGQIKKLPSFSSWRGATVAAFSLALLFLSVFGSFVKQGYFLARNGFVMKREQQLKYQIKFNDVYQTALTEVAFLSEPQSMPGDIFICGDPLYYLLSGRNQAIALNGWDLELLLPEQWTQLTEQLARVFPPYIFVSTYYLDIIKDRSPEVAQFIEKNYRVLRKSDVGIWYVHRKITY